jgi:hypothetical protein
VRLQWQHRGVVTEIMFTLTVRYKVTDYPDSVKYSPERRDRAARIDELLREARNAGAPSLRRAQSGCLESRAT